MANIVVIDPSPVDRKRMRNILEAAGHAVAEAALPSEAVKLLDRPRAVNLILTELQFPNATGLDFLRWLKQHDRLQALPVLVVTAHPSREMVIQMVKDGASTIITKPFGPDLLLRRVTEALAERAPAGQGEGLNLAWPVADYLRRELKRVKRHSSHFSVLVCRLLEPANERVVPLLMTRLIHLMRGYDMLARLGEREVLVLLPDTDSVGATAVESRIGQVVPAVTGEVGADAAMQIRVTTGIATFPSEAVDGDHLILLGRERCLSRLQAPLLGDHLLK